MAGFRRGTVLVALGALAATTATAAAQTTTYGGGSLPTTATPREYAPTVGITLQPRGDRVALRFDTSLKCGSRTYNNLSGRKAVPLRDGAFTARSASVLPLANRARLVFAWKVTGRLSGATATGTLRITGVRRAGGRDTRCRGKSKRPFSAMVPVAPAGPAALPPPRGAYAGLSALELIDGLQAPVFLRVSANGRKIAARWSARAPCTSGGRMPLTNFTPPTAVNADGTFTRAERFSYLFSDGRVRYRVLFTGRIAADGATGTLRMRARHFNPRGKLVTRCDTQTQAWNAAPVPAAGG